VKTARGHSVQFLNIEQSGIDTHALMMIMTMTTDGNKFYNFKCGANLQRLKMMIENAKLLKVVSTEIALFMILLMVLAARLLTYGLFSLHDHLQTKESSAPAAAVCSLSQLPIDTVKLICTNLHR
jgi:hypothetical protein